jgi:hypothetical protein
MSIQATDCSDRCCRCAIVLRICRRAQAWCSTLPVQLTSTPHAHQLRLVYVRSCPVRAPAGPHSTTWFDVQKHCLDATIIPTPHKVAQTRIATRSQTKQPPCLRSMAYPQLKTNGSLLQVCRFNSRLPMAHLSCLYADHKNFGRRLQPVRQQVWAASTMMKL